ncbi:MAG TPA: hypothetical protein PK230_04580 [Chitinophagales bacterium]|nr:hypothetical protein [Chitinophagales bacterium]
MIPFRTALGAVLRLRCPNCSQGNLFTDPNLLHLKNLDKMPHTCPHCGQDFKVEPEFYFGRCLSVISLWRLLCFSLWASIFCCRDICTPMNYSYTLASLR